MNRKTDGVLFEYRGGPRDGQKKLLMPYPRVVACVDDAIKAGMYGLYKQEHNLLIWHPIPFTQKNRDRLLKHRPDLKPWVERMHVA